MDTPAKAFLVVALILVVWLIAQPNPDPDPDASPVDAMLLAAPLAAPPARLAAVAGEGHNATGAPRFEVARVVRDPILSAQSWGSTQAYISNRLSQFRNTPAGFTYTERECPECDPAWNVPTASTASQRGLSATENMATAELDNEQIYNWQQGQRNLAQLAIHATYTSQPSAP